MVKFVVGQQANLNKKPLNFYSSILTIGHQMNTWLLQFNYLRSYPIFQLVKLCGFGHLFRILYFYPSDRVFLANNKNRVYFSRKEFIYLKVCSGIEEIIYSYQMSPVNWYFLNIGKIRIWVHKGAIANVSLHLYSNDKTS